MKKPLLPRRTAVNIMLYIGVIAMGLVTYYDVREEANDEPSVAVFDVDAVHQLTLHRPGYSTIVLQRKADSWYLTEPIDVEADDTRVEALLRLDSLDPSAAYSVTELDLTELGLGIPQATLNFGDEEQSIQILLGGLGPNQTRRYIQIGQWVWLVDDIYLPLVQGGLRAFARLALLPMGTTLSAVRGPNGTTLTDSPTLDAWHALQAAGIDPAHVQIMQTTPTVELTTQTGETLVYQLLTGDNEFALVPQGHNYALLVTHAQAQQLGVAQ
ncbi:MAG: DUF4340 domain-containing protein [Pseudomonadota bacterium]